MARLLVVIAILLVIVIAGVAFVAVKKQHQDQEKVRLQQAVLDRNAADQKAADDAKKAQADKEAADKAAKAKADADAAAEAAEKSKKDADARALADAKAAKDKVFSRRTKDSEGGAITVSSGEVVQAGS